MTNDPDVFDWIEGVIQADKTGGHEKAAKVFQKRSGGRRRRLNLDYQTIRHMRAEGMHDAVIAKHFGCSCISIRRYAMKGRL